VSENGLIARGHGGKASPRPERLPAAERRQALVDAALRVFSAGSYAGATTAEIAREAGVSEPILYRHFASKRELYFACLDEAWRRLQAVIERDERALEAGRPLAAVFARLGKEALSLRVLTANLWMQAITEAGEDPEIRRFVRKHMRRVHDYYANLLRRAQAAGSVPRDRDADAEAWIFLAGALLLSLGDRLGGLPGERELEAIRAQRLRWLSGA
jgi:TetR/AcrR family transcriptional regulator